MDPDDGLDDDGPLFAWLPPDDRLWRHPSEIRSDPPTRPLSPVSLARRGTSTRTWTVAVLAGVVGALLASGLGVVSGAFGRSTTIVRPVTSPAAPTVSLASVRSGPATDWTVIDDAVAPAVVSVDVNTDSGPISGSGLVYAAGSGWVYVLTDSSLTEQGGQVLTTFAMGYPRQATVVGQDPMTGLALLKVAAQRPTFPLFGSAAELRDATPVLALGARSATGGSAFPGSVTAQDQQVAVAGGRTMEDLLAVSAPTVPPGAAGGPLVDQNGRVVGVTVDISPTDTTYQALAFAVPTDVALHVAGQLLSGQRVTHPWVGLVDATDLASTSARQMGLPGGAQVGSVWPGSPAGDLGIVASDVITSFDGKTVTSAGSLVSLLDAATPGSTAPISFLHRGKSVSSRIAVVNQPASDGS